MGEPRELEEAAATSAAPPALSWPVLLLVMLAAGHLAWLLVNFGPAYFAPDANGYYVQGRLLATAGTTELRIDSPAQFVGMHWLETADGTLRSRYPAGLPVMIAAVYRLAGPGAALLLNPFFACGTVLLTFALARRLMGGWPALLAAAVVALNATANRHALSADAHTAAAFFLLAGVGLLWRFTTNGRPLAGLAAGLLLGVVPAIRYPEAVCGAAAGAWLLWRVRPWWRAWPAALGAALPLGGLLAHNAAAYGAFWKTGYAYTNEQTGFSLANLVEHAGSYLRGLGGQQGLLLFFGFSLAGFAALIADRARRAVGVLFAGLVVPLLLVYMAYYWGAGGGPAGGTAGMRFLIPAFPYLAIAGAWLLAEIARSAVPGARAAVLAVAALQLVLAAGDSAREIAGMGGAMRAAARVRAALEQRVPAGAVLVVNDRQLAESLDYTGRWRLADATLLLGPGGAGGMFPGPRRGLGPPAIPGRGIGGGRPPVGVARDPNAPSPMQAGKLRGERQRYQDLAPGERRARVWADLREWAQPDAGAKTAEIYWLAPSAEAIENQLPGGADYELLAEVEGPRERGPGAGPMGARRNLLPGGPGGGGNFAGPGRGGPGLRPAPGVVEPGAMTEAPAVLVLARVTFAGAVAQN